MELKRTDSREVFVKHMYDECEKARAGWVTCNYYTSQEKHMHEILHSFRLFMTLVIRLQFYCVRRELNIAPWEYTFNIMIE